MNIATVDQILEKYGRKRSAVIEILQDTQENFNYVPAEVITHISEQLHVPLIDIYGICTFYKSFSLKPRGRRTITVCLGTACHVRGAPRIADEFHRRLKIEPGETTPDNEFTFETVNCLGCCALGPIVVVGGEYHGHTTTRSVSSLLEAVKEKSDLEKKEG